MTHCVHCGIRFLTHPRNAGRADLRCPFGCRRQHHQHRSSERSTSYYRTVAGKGKKKRLNGRRHFHSTPEQQPIAAAYRAPQGVPINEPPNNNLAWNGELRLGGVVLNEANLLKSRMLPYVRMVVSLIEGIEFSYQELLLLLRQAMRQHSIAKRTRSEYVLLFLHEHPP